MHTRDRVFGVGSAKLDLRHVVALWVGRTGVDVAFIETRVSTLAANNYIPNPNVCNITRVGAIDIAVILWVGVPHVGIATSS